MDKETAQRDALLQRIMQPHAYEEKRPEGKPLDWEDIGLLAHGLSFGNRTVLYASKRVAERYNLGPRGAWMLNLIALGLVYPHELSDVLKIGRSLISAELARLTEAGLIASKSGKKDRRRLELTLTPLGEITRGETRDELFRSLTEALAAYTPDQIRLMAQMLHDLQASAGPLTRSAE